MTAADILFKVGQFVANISDEEQPYIVHSIWFDEVYRETQFVPFFTPDEFLCDVQEAFRNRWRPIALEAVEDDEAEECACIDWEYLMEEPTVEDAAIVESMFAVSD